MDFKAQYLAAVKRDEDVRDAAFLDLTTRICGIEIHQVDIRAWLILEGLGNPFVCGGIYSVQDAAKFLWHLSPDYRPGWWAAWRFGRRCRHLDEAQLTKGITTYLDDTFQDAPGKRHGPDPSGPPFASFAAHLVHKLAKQYAWGLWEIVGTEKQRGIPLKVIFQLNKFIRCSEEEKPELRSRRVLKARGDALRAIQPAPSTGTEGRN